MTFLNRGPSTPKARPPRIATALRALEVEAVTLSRHPRNARRHDLRAIGASLAEFGQLKPIVVQASSRLIVSGNGTWLAATSGYADPRVYTEGLSPELGEPWRTIAASIVPLDDEQATAFLLADNRTQEVGGYDDVALAPYSGRHPPALTPARSDTARSTWIASYGQRRAGSHPMSWLPTDPNPGRSSASYGGSAGTGCWSATRRTPRRSSGCSAGPSWTSSGRTRRMASATRPR